jgi:hypothetical protein
MCELDHSEMLNRWSLNLTTDKAAVITPEIARRFNTDKTKDYQCSLQVLRKQASLTEETKTSMQASSGTTPVATCESDEDDFNLTLTMRLPSEKQVKKVFAKSTGSHSGNSRVDFDAAFFLDLDNDQEMDMSHESP